MGFREPDVYQEAIQLVEDVIAEATKEGDELTAQVVMDHTALLNGAGRNACTIPRRSGPETERMNRLR